MLICRAAAFNLKLYAKTSDANMEETLAVCVMLSVGLKYIWESRVGKKVVVVFKMRAEIEAVVSILRRSRHKNTNIIIEECLQTNLK